MNRVKHPFWGLFGILLFLTGPLEAQTSYSRGEELFMQNKPEEAVKFLESATGEDPAHVNAFLYLGITYLQLNRLDDAIAAYKRILPRAGAETARVAFNLGNVYFSKGDYDNATLYFSQSIAENPAFSSAYLNRANTAIRKGMLEEAITDYREYLSYEPNSPKRGEIERLINFIYQEKAEAERRRILAEEAAIAAEIARVKAEEEARAEAERLRLEAEAEAERQRLAAEAEAARLRAIAEAEAERQRLETERLRAEAEAEAERIRLEAEEAERLAAERTRRLLEEISQSLHAVGGDSKGLSTGAEDVLDYEGEFELE